MREIITTITAHSPESLLKLYKEEDSDHEPQTVYSRVKDLDKVVGERCGLPSSFARLVYDSIFEHLAVPHQIHEALYAGGGMLLGADCTYCQLT
jgi:hypothetical protein